MEERNIDIEKWLQQAAARQEQEQTAPAEKQEAWDAMLGMLDQPAVPPRRSGWKFWLGGALLLGIVIYFMLPGAEDSAEVKKDEVRVTQSGAVDEKEGVVPDDEKDNLKINKNEAPGEEKNKVEADKGEAIGGGKNNPGLVENEGPGEGNTKVEADERGAVGAGKNNPGPNENEGPGEGRNKAVDAGKDNLKLNKNEGPGERKNNVKANNPVSGNNAGLSRTSPASKNNRETATPSGITKSGAAQSGRAIPVLPGSAAPPIPSEQTGRRQTAQFNTSGTVLWPTASIPRLTTEPDASLSRSISGIPYKPVTHGVKSYAASGFSVRVAGTMPVNNAYGVNIAAEYTFNFFNRLRLRPYAGAAYLTGFNKPYKHTAFYARPFGPGTGTDRIFLIDSIVTTYQATSLWLGEGGLQVAYAHKRWELMAGIGYQRSFKVNGTKDTTFTTRYDSIHAPNYHPELFSKSTLPGVGKLILQAGVNYMITPRLQGGVRYSLQLQASRGGRGYNFRPQSGGSGGNVSGYEPALPLQSSLEVQVRWYFRKKKESSSPTN